MLGIPLFLGKRQKIMTVTADYNYGHYVRLRYIFAKGENKGAAPSRCIQMGSSPISKYRTKRKSHPGWDDFFGGDIRVKLELKVARQKRRSF